MHLIIACPNTVFVWICTHWKGNYTLFRNITYLIPYSRTDKEKNMFMQRYNANIDYSCWVYEIERLFLDILGLNFKLNLNVRENTLFIWNIYPSRKNSILLSWKLQLSMFCYTLCFQRSSTWKCSRGCGSQGVVGEAGCAGVTGVAGSTGGGFGYRDGLFHTGRHLTHRVASDPCISSRGGVHVILHHRGQHGNVVAFRAYHRVLGAGGVALFGGPGAL